MILQARWRWRKAANQPNITTMAKKDKKVNAWQIIVAVFQALAALFGSLKKSHDSAHEDAAKEPSSEDPSANE